MISISQLNHEGEFERAWVDPGKTRFELPPVKYLKKLQTKEKNMVKKGSIAAIIFSAVLALSSGCATPVSPHAPAVRSGYAPVNGLKMYYEIHGTMNGETPPLFLLHGGGSTIETSFGKVLPALAKTR